MSSPEVTRVYVGSFWQEPLRSMDNAALFEDEERDLMKDLAILPRQSAVRKINEVSFNLYDESHHPLGMRCIILNF
jgi:EH domain-containing protein 1